MPWTLMCMTHAYQVLPLVPPEEAFWSPYTGLDALCGSTLMISLDELVKEGLLDSADLPDLIETHLPADFFKVRHTFLTLPGQVTQGSLQPLPCACCTYKSLMRARGPFTVSRKVNPSR